MKNQPSTGKVRWIDLSGQSFFAKKIKARRFLAGAIALILTIFYSSGILAQVTVAGSAGAANGSYATLNLAFDALNLETTQAGNVITISITGSTTETVSAVLNQPAVSSWTSLTITPSGGAWTISGSIAGHLIDLNGADNVIIDGLNSGGNALTIENTLAAATPTAIRFINDASNNVVQNCTIKSATTGASLGTIFFSSGTTTGNDGNNINNNIITSSGANFASAAIVSTSGIGINSENIVNANAISDYYNATAISSGITLATAGNSAWTITNNRLFQSALRLYTTPVTHYGIFVGSGSGYTITGNTIGFANAGGTGMTMMVGNSVPLSGTFPSAWNNTGTANATRYIAINCGFTAAGTVSEIQNNTIGGFALYTSSGATTTNGIWCGINVTSGNVNIGTSIGNTIGATTGQGSVYTACNTAGGAAVGIFVASANTVSIQNNNIGAIDAAGAVVASGCGGITGIDVSGAGSFTISGNFIGNATANNLRAGNLATGATLSNTGTFVTTSGTGACIGIRSAATGGPLTITSNTLRGFGMSSTASSASSAFTGITNTGAATTSINISNNFLGTASVGLLNYAFAIGASSALTGINCSTGGTAAPITISTNDIRGIVYAVPGSNPHTYISWNHANSGADLITGNTFTNLNVNTAGSITFMNRGTSNMAATGSLTVSSNSIVTAFNKGTAGGTVTFYTNAGGSSSVTGSTTLHNLNNFSNVTLTGVTAVLCWSDADGPSSSSGPFKTISNNTFNNITTGAAQITGISHNFSGVGATVTGNTISNLTGGIILAISTGTSNGGVQTISSNTISNLTGSGQINVIQTGFNSNTTTGNINNNSISSVSSSGAANPVFGIICSGFGVTTNIFKNSICNMQSDNAGATLTGIICQTSGTTYNISNNRLGELRTPSSNAAAANQLVGISIGALTGATSVNVFYNTVNLNAMSSGAQFGSSAILANITPTVTLNNNIFVNTSIPSGAGLSVAYRRSGVGLVTYGGTSDRNLFFAPTFFTDGTNTFADLASYKAFVGPTIDANSVSENPPFLSTTCGNANFLKISTGTPTLVESSGANVGTITDDFENDIRFGNGGYAGTGTAPDIGADEFEGMPSLQCMGTPTAGSITGVNAVCTGSGTTLTLTGASTDIGITYQWRSGTTMGGPYPNTLGTTTSQNTGPLTVPTYFIAEVTCTNGGSTVTTTEKPISINPLPSVGVSPMSGLICSPGGAAIPLTASGGLTYAWSPTAGLSPTTGSPVSANPTQTTIYTVTGTDINGCTNTATSTITVSGAVTGAMASANPNPFCIGDNLNLTASASTAGYTMSSSLSTCFVDISATGTAVTGAIADDSEHNITLPFSFTFNGTPYTTARVGNNGALVFGTTTDDIIYTNSALPQGFAPTSTGSTGIITSSGGNTSLAALCAFWDDLLPGTGGSIRTQQIGTTFYIQWTNEDHFSATGAFITFQIQLEQTTNIIRFSYADVNFSGAGSAAQDFGGSATVGLNFSASSGLQYSFNTQTLVDGQCITFAPATLSYAWSGPDSFTSGIQNPTIPSASALAAGMYTVTATSAGGCSSTASVSVTSNPTPVLSGPSAVCTGHTIQLMPNVGGTWVSNNMPVATISASGLVMGMTAGVATFTFTSAAGCMATTGNVTVSLSPSATITAPPSVYQGSSGNMASVPNAGVGATYLWSLSSGMITGGNGTNMISFNAGTPPSMMVNVTVTSSNGCSSSSNVSVNVLVPGPSSMVWQPDYLEDYSCGSVTNCCLDTLCFNLVYTPGVDGYITTYTTGFFGNCLGGMVPLGYNRSCVMGTNNMVVLSQCMTIDSFLFNSSGNNGNLVLVNTGVPEILHKACFNVETNESLQIREDIITNLTASIDLIGGGQLTEFPTYATQLFSKPAPVIPANVTVNVDCPADTIAPVPPEVVDFCGNTVGVTLVSKTNMPSPMTCEGTQVYHYEYEDCSGYVQPWSYTYHVEYLDFSIATPSGGSIVQCQTETNVVPTPPTVTDNCGNVLVPVITNTGPQVCEGLRFYTFTYTDCEGNNHNWVYGYFIENEPIPNPVDSMKTVACPLLANVTPTPPVVMDNCGNVLAPTGPTSTPALLVSTCEGSRTFTWNYMDCEGNTQDFKYTYNVEREPFADPADDGSMVTCPAQTNTVPTPPAVIDNCGNAITPAGPMVSTIPACEGTRTYTWTYSDCEGNTANYVYTYTVVRPEFTIPMDDGISTNCAADADVVPVAPMVTDACSVSLIPVDTIISPQVICTGFNQIRTYTFVYMDCAGHTHNWVYTYTVNCNPLTLRVFLEGPYEATGDSMRSTLNFLRVLPGQDKSLSPSLSIQLQAPYTPFGQPYNTPPWNYAGTEGGNFGDPTSPGAPMVVIPYPDDIVDWVLVSIRMNGILPMHEIWTCAGLVHTDGEVTFPSICPGLVLTPNDSFYILVKHRTHLGVLTPIAADMPCSGYSLSWDFTLQNSFEPIFRYGEKFISPPGKWVMHDANGEQILSIPTIGSADRNTWKIFQNAYGYNLGDFNMNGQAESGGDESAWKINQNKASGILFY